MQQKKKVNMIFFSHVCSEASKPTITADLRFVCAEVHGSIHKGKVAPPMEHVKVYGDTSLQDL